MNRHLPALADQTFDVLAIGGGILGAGVARDASLRGLSVALVEQADFAGATSSRSSKLIHGGFRYLEQGAFHLVAEACRERQVLQRIAPHLVRMRQFLLPVYQGDPRALARIRLGMTLYDWIGRHRSPEPHQFLTPEQTLQREPALARDGLRGAVAFYDCQEDDARFCLENVIHAAAAGAVSANYCELTGFVVRQDRIVAAQVADRMGAGTWEIQARAYVNAAGPWVERVADLVPGDGQRVALSPTKGVHLLLPAVTANHGAFFQARRDGRFLFVVPWNDCSLVGTTDTEFAGDPNDVRAEPADIEYLLNEVNAIVPGAGVGPGDVIATFAGVRALVRSDKAAPSARSRDHLLARHGANLISIAGGKFTTYRAIAEQVVDQLCQILGKRVRRCGTAETPLPEHRPPPAGPRLAGCPEVYASDVVHACEREQALTLTDVMRRRTGLFLSRHGGPDTATAVARVMAQSLGWSETQTQEQLQEYLTLWKRARP